MSPKPRKLLFLVLPGVHVQDLAGPAQVFHEANPFGGRYDLRYCGLESEAVSAQGLAIARLESLAETHPDDLVVVPGIDSSTLGAISPRACDWLRRGHEVGTRIASVCSGAFALARAGLLDGRTCTTYWKIADRLAHEFPAARVVRNRLYVDDGAVVTSAVVTAGIDLALYLVERDHGPLVVARVAREMVVYIRRSGESPQKSVYLDYRTHLHPGIHRVQDRLVACVGENPSMRELAEVAGMSPRNLTRAFRQATGVTLSEFRTRLRMEVAESLLRSPDNTVEAVAADCGFKDPRQLRRIWIRTHGVSPSAWRARVERRSEP
jgi:transcriptional regulator GlxA family with amidase domain